MVRMSGDWSEFRDDQVVFLVLPPTAQAQPAFLGCLLSLKVNLL